MHDNSIESLFAAEDAAIKDDGFSAAVLETVGRRRLVRRVTIAGASLVGGMVASVSLSGMKGPGEAISGWFRHVDGAVTEVVKAPALSQIGPELAGGMGGATMIALVAGLAALSMCIAAVTLQER